MPVANLQQNHCFYKYYGNFFRFEDSTHFALCLTDRPSPTEGTEVTEFFPFVHLAKQPQKQIEQIFYLPILFNGERGYVE